MALMFSDGSAYYQISFQKSYCRGPSIVCDVRFVWAAVAYFIRVEQFLEIVTFFLPLAKSGGFLVKPSTALYFSVLSAQILEISVAFKE